MPKEVKDDAPATEPAVTDTVADAEPQADAPAADAEPAEAPEAAEEPEAEAPAEPAEVPQAPAHTAFMDHADADASASHLGVPIVRGENGFFLVPLAFAEELKSHGFTVVSEGQ